MPPVVDNERLKRIMKAFQPVYTKAGIDLTEEKMEELLHQAPSNEVRLARRCVEMKDRRDELAETTYHRKKEESAIPAMDLFGRIYITMMQPGEDAESVKTNQRLQELSATKDGQMQIVTKATDTILNMDPNLLFGEGEQMFQNYIDHFTEVSLAFIPLSIWDCRKSFAKEQSISQEQVDLYNANNLFLQNAGNIERIAGLVANPLYQLLPPKTDFASLFEDFTTGKLAQESGVELQGEDYKFIMNFLGTAMQIPDMLGMFREDKIKYNNDVIKRENITFGKLKGTHSDWAFMDDKGKPLPDDALVEYDKKYAIVNAYGEVRGIHIGENAQPEQIEANLPDSFLRNHQTEFGKAVEQLRMFDRLSSKISGVYGEKVNLSREFEKVAPNLKDCDYTLPEGVVKELGECVTMGAFLSPAIFEHLSTSSTRANQSVENRIEFGAMDWIRDDERSINFDTVLADVRKGMTKMFEQAKAGDTKEIKEAFMRTAELVGKEFLEVPSQDSEEACVAQTLAEKFVKVIESNPYGIATDMKPEVKNAIYMKANMLKASREEAEAKASLLYSANLSPEAKRAKIVRSIACREMKNLHKQGIKYPTVTDITDDIKTKLGTQELPGAGYIGDEESLYRRDYRMHNPSAMDRAMAQKYPELLAAVEAAIPKEEIDKLVSLPGVMLAKRLDQVKIDPTKMAIPSTTEKVSAKINEELKQKFADKAMALAKRGIAEDEEYLDRAMFKTVYTGEEELEQFVSTIEGSLKNTNPGMLGSSYEFQRVELAFDRLKKVCGKAENSANTVVAAEKLSNFCRDYLNVKLAEGVNPESNSTSGRRFRDVQEVLRTADRIANHAKKLNEMTIGAKDSLDSDILHVQDAVRISNLRANLSIARKALDEADPMFHRSSPRFKAIASALNNSIRQLREYGKSGVVNPEEEKALARSLTSLEYETRQYINEKHPSSNLGIQRLEAVTKVLDVVKGQAQVVLSRNQERALARDVKAKEYAAKENAADRNVGDQHAKELTRVTNSIKQYVDVYHNNEVHSKKFDQNQEVTKLAYRVRTASEYVDNTATGKTHVFTEEMKLIRSMVADRMIFDMIVKERAESKDDVFEKCFAANPKGVKKSLLAHPQVKEAIDQFATSKYDGRVEALEKLGKVSGEVLEAARAELIEKNAPQAAPATKEATKAVEEANMNLPQ